MDAKQLSMVDINYDWQRKSILPYYRYRDKTGIMADTKTTVVDTNQSTINRTDTMMLLR